MNLLLNKNYLRSSIYLSNAVRMSASAKKSLYSVLGISQRATQKDVKDAFIRKSKLYHPDVNSTLEAKNKFQEVSEAYQILGNTVTRKSYDRGVFIPFRNSDPDSSASPFHSPEAEAFRQGRHSSRRVSDNFSRQSESFNFESFYKEHYSENISKSHVKKKGRESAAAGGEISSQREDSAVMSIFTWVSLATLAVLVGNFFMK